MHMRIQKTLASFFAVVVLAAANATAYAAATHRFTEKDRQEVKDVFLRQAAAATAHDIVAFERVLASAPPGQPDPIAFVARAYQFWGKPALIEHFKETFKGVWKFEPNVESIKIVPLTADVAQLYAPTQITLGASEASARSAPFLVYEVAVRTPEGWRIASIVPVPAPAQ
jgi:hypothetical protein